MSTITTTETLALILRGGVTYLNDATVHMAADRLVSQSMRIHGLIDEIERLRLVVEAWLAYSQRAERDIETLRAERDEARRMVCGLDADLMEDQREYARHRGWDCFDITPNDIEAHEVRGDVAGSEGAD